MEVMSDAAGSATGDGIVLSGIEQLFRTKDQEVLALTEIDLTISAGEFLVLLGPSGCGKTTLLRCISGFQEPSWGEVRIGGKNMAGIGPNKRPTALIFQNLALFPLMSVADNIAFPREVRGVGCRFRKYTAAAPKS